MKKHLFTLWTNRNEETEDLGTSTLSAALSGASWSDANIPALSICSSNSCESVANKGSWCHSDAECCHAEWSSKWDLLVEGSGLLQNDNIAYYFF